MNSIHDYESSRIDILRKLDSEKTQSARNQLGQFATPPVLALDIVRCAVALLPKDGNLRYLEPGFGTGAFFSAVRCVAKERQIETAVGYEVDPHYGQAAAGLWRNTELSLKIADFTSVEPPSNDKDRFNLVVSNPPYVRHHHLTRQQKISLRHKIAQHFSIEMNGLTGLYAYFMVLSQRWMRKSGVGAWLVPSEFMDVNYGQKLKEFLVKCVTLERIHRFDPSQVQFDDALVSSAVVLFRNAKPPANHRVEFSHGGTVCEPAVSKFIDGEVLLSVRKWSQLTSRSDVAAKTAGEATLADLFSIKRGLATGDNEFFILAPEQIERLEIPREFLMPILPSPRYLSSDQVYADDVGDPLLGRKRYLLTCNLAEDAVAQGYPSLWSYYEHGASVGVKERYLCQHRRPWYAQEQRPAAPILCSYMGRTVANKRSPFRFIRNYSKATAANVYLMLYPKPALQNVANKHPEVLDLIWTELRAIDFALLKAEGRIYGGGLHKMEPAELGNVSARRLFDSLMQFGFAERDVQRELFLAG
ncbi:MAG: Eco57I restriction-modification methylase domain-containing protein [Planctomycetes bacterium]|nr:Eco57I restriction-modification methylase domain-containing protein [Planctomycetota bacterium]